jgi:hypothetical protein
MGRGAKQKASQLFSSEKSGDPSRFEPILME